MERRGWRSWLSPPAMDDPITSEQARTLHTIILAISAICVLLVLAHPLFPAASWKTTLGFYGPVFVVQGIAAWLLHHKRVLTAAWFYSSFIFAIMSASLLLFGGLTVQNSGSFILVVLIAGFVIGGRGALTFAVLSIAVGAAVYLAERSGRMPQPVLRMGPEEVLAGLIVNTSASAVLVHLALRRLLRALRTTKEREMYAAGLAEFGRKVVGVSERAAVYRATLRYATDVLPVKRAAVVATRRDTGAAVVLAGFPDADRSELDKGLADWTTVEILPGDDPTLLAVRFSGATPPAGAEGFLQTLAQMAGSVIKHAAAEEELRQAQKLEVVGMLAGGIAHDFNNLLTSMLGAARLLAHSKDGSGNADLLDVIIRGGERASLLTKQILAFASNQPSSPTHVDLNRVISDLIPMLRRVIPERITIDADLSSQPITVFADRSQLEQVLLNLVVNARDAIEEAGEIRLSTSLTEHPDATFTAVFTVSDDGNGMEAEVAERIFQPFFTTKQGQGGTGLGLSTVKRIVDGLGGQTEVVSQLGKGTEFRISLPATSDAGETERSVAKVGPRVPLHARVLLVEDEPTVRQVLSRTLEELGLLVTTVDEGQSALELIDGGTPFDVVVSDLVMPRMGGIRLANLLAERPTAPPIVLLSGYSGERSSADIPSGVAVLAKPVDSQVLLDAIRSAVERAKPASRTA